MSGTKGPWYDGFVKRKLFFSTLSLLIVVLLLFTCVPRPAANKPTLIYPKDNERDVRFNGLELSFEVPTSGEYEVIVRDPSDSTAFSTTVIASGGRAFVAVPKERLRPATQYRWFVRLRNDHSVMSDIWRFTTRNNTAPRVFDLRPDKLDGVPFGAVPLTWKFEDPDDDAVRFEVKVYKKNVEAPVFERSFSEDSGVVKDLEQLTEYSWTIVAVDTWGARSSAVTAEFKTKPNEPPRDLRLIEPDRSPTRFNRLRLRWEGVDPDYEDLRYTVTISSPGTETRSLLVNQVNTEYVVDLRPSTSYTLKIRASDKYGATLDREFNFRTVENTPPTTPTLRNPENNARLNLKRITSVDFTWDAATDTDADEVFYRIVVGNRGTTIEERNNLDINGYTISVAGGKLLAGERYTWFVESYDKWGGLRRSSEYAFEVYSNSPPSKPSNPTPRNGATNQPNRIRFSWVSTDEDGDSLKYDFYIGESPERLTLEASGLQEPSYLRPALLEFSKTYYWKVVVRDDYNEPVEGDVWTFRVTDEDRPPTAPTLIEPANESVRVPFNNLRFRWSASSDRETPQDRLIYELVLGEPDTMEATRTLTGETGATVEARVSGLRPLTTYNWRVEVRDSFGNYAYSTTWSFRTKANSSPTAPSNPSPANGAILTPGLVQFSWSARDEDEDVLTYEFRIARSPEALDAATPVIRNVPNHEITVTEEGTYYWRITARDPHGGVSSSTWFFTIRRQ